MKFMTAIASASDRRIRESVCERRREEDRRLLGLVSW
jgi:hypothetical protein